MKMATEQPSRTSRPVIRKVNLPMSDAQLME
jgi:hypothetical protein